MFRSLLTRQLTYQTKTICSIRPLVQLKNNNTTFKQQSRLFSSTNIKMAGNTITTVADFAEKTKQPQLSVISFKAVWCGPCRTLAPKMEQFAEKTPSATFYNIDVDECPDIAQENGISAMPTVLFFKNGEKVGSVVGANLQQIKSLIDQHA